MQELIEFPILMLNFYQKLLFNSLNNYCDKNKVVQ